jgi:hypothetical protein
LSRPDRDRVADAMEAGTRARLRDELGRGNVDELFELWAVEASIRGLDRHDHAYWDAAWPWLVEHGRR